MTLQACCMIRVDAGMFGLVQYARETGVYMLRKECWPCDRTYEATMRAVH